MKTFKFIDCCIQVLLAVFWVAWVCSYYPEDEALLAYFIVGAWNLVSCLVHVASKYNMLEGSSRSKYYRNMLWILIVGGGSWVFGGVFNFFLSGFFIIYPLTIGIYINICYEETLSHLKPTRHEK